MAFIPEFLKPETLICLGLVLILAVMVLQQNKKIEIHEQRLKLLKNDIRALLVCSRGVGNKLNSQFTEFRNLIERQDRLELGDSGDPAYRQAMVLLDRGVSEEEMIDTCDLTRAEVELIAQLRGNHAPSAPGHIELVA